MPVNNLLTLRNGTSTQWLISNPVLAKGEPGYDITNNIIKIGDGSSSWSNLSTISSSKNTILSDVVDATNYIGYAIAGSSTSSNVWTIKRTIYSSAGSISSTTTATNVAWTNRTSASYS